MILGQTVLEILDELISCRMNEHTYERTWSKPIPIVSTKNWCNYLENEEKIENRETGEAPILKEVEKAVQMLKNDKSPGVDNISAEIQSMKGIIIDHYRRLHSRMSENMDQCTMAQELGHV